jgi:hypothetical protein
MRHSDAFNETRKRIRDFQRLVGNEGVALSVLVKDAFFAANVAPKTSSKSLRDPAIEMVMGDVQSNMSKPALRNSVLAAAMSMSAE